MRLHIGLITMLMLAKAHAGIIEITVGVTPSCPEGFMGCWNDAKQALQKIDDVQSVATNPDLYNATASVQLKDGRVPDPIKWAEQFEKVIGKRIAFRGVEITVEGVLKNQGEELYLHLPEFAQPLRVVALDGKIQWNFNKKHARGSEEEERRAFSELTVASKAKNPLKVRVTGPLRNSNGGLKIEVREFFLDDAAAE